MFNNKSFATGCLFITLLVSCNGNKTTSEKYIFKNTYEITYINGDIDTIVFENITTRECNTRIDISNKHTPCIVTGCGIYPKIVACNVRHFKTLKSEKSKYN